MVRRSVAILEGRYRADVPGNFWLRVVLMLMSDPEPGSEDPLPRRDRPTLGVGVRGLADGVERVRGRPRQGLLVRETVVLDDVVVRVHRVEDLHGRAGRGWQVTGRVVVGEADPL